MESVKLDKYSMLDLIRNKTTDLDLSQIIVRLDINPDLIKTDKMMRHQSERLFQVKGIDPTMDPLTEFVKEGGEPNFKEHFRKNYHLKTTCDLQPLVEIDEIKANMNFIINELEASTTKKEFNYKMMFIAEHLIVVPFHPSWLKVLCMIPAIFHRANLFKKAEKLKSLIQSSIVDKLQIKMVSLIDKQGDTFSRRKNVNL
jgi:hypothetical protein